jgi:hypothetical protein
MKINIITICTGKYTIFFEDFYKSCENFFLKNHDNQYFVFTDGDIIERDNINKICQKKLGWPYDTMFRFKMFNSIKDVLTGEYTFFFNANMLFVDYINEEVLPSESNNYLMGVNHPGYYKNSINQFPYERRIESNFYIPYGEGKTYFQGCFNGGRTEEFMIMSEKLDELIDNDLSKGIIPIWHDESALNWYYSKINPLMVNPGYSYTESVDIPFEKKIIQLDKNKYGGHANLRK